MHPSDIGIGYQSPKPGSDIAHNVPVYGAIRSVCKQQSCSSMDQANSIASAVLEFILESLTNSTQYYLPESGICRSIGVCAYNGRLIPS